MPPHKSTTRIVLNDYGAQKRHRQRSGKAYLTVHIEAEPLVVHFDTRRLGEGPAKAIAATISDGIRGITEQAAPSTIARRQEARKAWARGEQWAIQRYGARMPGRTTKVFNDSRRLADEIGVKPDRGKDGGWLIVFPPGRFELGALGSPPEHVQRRMLDRLTRIVDVLRDPEKLMRSRRVRKALEEAHAAMFERAKRGKR